MMNMLLLSVAGVGVCFGMAYVTDKFASGFFRHPEQVRPLQSPER